MRIHPIESRHLASRRFADNMALVDVATRKLHSLNPTAALLWGAITKGSTIDELVEVLCTTYEVEVEAARKDVEGFVELLVSEGLVTRDLGLPAADAASPLPRSAG